MNVCQAIQCPYYRDGANSGCQYYLVALHCHLMWQEAGVKRQEYKASISQYALFSTLVDVDSEKKLNEDYFKVDETYQRHVELLEARSYLMDYPNRIL